MRRLLEAALGAEAASLRVLGMPPGAAPVVEDGADYAANAAAKARAAQALAPTAAALADDSGVEVEILGGAPGLLSARWATGPRGEPLDGAGLNAALLRRLEGVPPGRRAARLVCAVALALPGGRLATGWGELQGAIGPEPRGPGGFGYDAVFVLPDGRALGEVEPAVKDRLGHRGQAVRAVAAELRRWLRAVRA